MNIISRQLLTFCVCALGFTFVNAQSTSLNMQVPPRISGVSDASLTHVHVQCVVNDGRGGTWGAGAERFALSGGALNRTVNLTVNQLVGSAGIPAEYSCFMAFARGAAGADMVDPSTLRNTSLTARIEARL
ncbi:MAG: hypothetical protein ACKO1L_12405 [Brachymonas sp.]